LGQVYYSLKHSDFQSQDLRKNIILTGKIQNHWRHHLFTPKNTPDSKKLE